MAQDQDSKHAAKSNKNHESDKTQTQPVDSAPNERQQDRNWNLGRLFWGLLLVLVGGLILASNFGWLTVSWDNLWRLWPLAIIAAGLSVLSVRSRVWRLATLLLILLTLASVAFVATGWPLGDHSMRTYTTTSQKLAAVVTSANISLKAGMSQIHITSADQDAVAVAKFDSGSTASLNEQSSRNGTIQQTDLTANVNNQWWLGTINSTLDLSLTRSLPVTLSLDIGASDTTADLSQVQLQALNVKAGATKLDLTLGDRSAVTNVDIESGASSVILRVPQNSGVRIKLDGGMMSSHMADLQNNNGTYESAGCDSAAKKINVTGRLGLASFTIERY